MKQEIKSKCKAFSCTVS